MARTTPRPLAPVLDESLFTGSELDAQRRLAGLRPLGHTETDAVASPFWHFDRQTWAQLADATPLPLTSADVMRLRGLGEPIDVDEVSTIYRPLSRLINLYSAARGHMHETTRTFLAPLGDQRRAPYPERTPFVIGVAGSVAVGKSTTARVLREMLARWPDTPHVQLITTDGFLFSNAELERRGILDRKGFPESYDRRGLTRFLAKVKSGADVVRAPVYSHHSYDIVPGAEVTVRRPDILIVEGLNVLQPPQPRSDGRLGVSVSDFFDFSIFVDAAAEVIKGWYLNRFLRLKHSAFTDPNSYFHQFSSLSDEAASNLAEEIWDTINSRNLTENVIPSRGRASLILHKSSDHSISRIQLRKL